MQAPQGVRDLVLGHHSKYHLKSLSPSPTLNSSCSVFPTAIGAGRRWWCPEPADQQTFLPRDFELVINQDFNQHRASCSMFISFTSSLSPPLPRSVGTTSLMGIEIVIRMNNNGFVCTPPLSHSRSYYNGTKLVASRRGSNCIIISIIDHFYNGYYRYFKKWGC